MKFHWNVAARKSFLALCTFCLFSGTLHGQGDAASTFKSKCAVCHGPDGSGNTAVGKSMKLHDLGSEEVQKQTDQELTAIITNGKGGMPSYKDKLSIEQIKSVVAYIRELAKKK